MGDEADAVLHRLAGWTHTLRVVEVVAREPRVSYPRCVSGQGACPPEHVGGPWGYEDFLEAVAGPSDPEHEQYREWVGGAFDPAAFDPVRRAATGARLRRPPAGGRRG